MLEPCEGFRWLWRSESEKVWGAAGVIRREHQDRERSYVASSAARTRAIFCGSSGAKAGAAADFAGDFDVGGEVHFDGFDALALAGFATAAFDVEGEAAHFVAADFGFAGHGEDFSDFVEDAGVGGGIGSWSATNR